MTRNYVGYFKTCLLALILCLSKMYPWLLILSVVESENLNLCDECSHCSLCGHSSQIFSLSDSTTYNKNASPIQCSNVEKKPYTMIKNCYGYFWTCLSIFLFSGGDWKLQYFNEYSYRCQYNCKITSNCPILMNFISKYMFSRVLKPME